MVITEINKNIKSFFTHKYFLNGLIILLFALIFSGVLVSKYAFFQTVADSDNKSKITVTAPNDIEIIDTIKTEKRKREVSQKVALIYSPADDTYIKDNLNEITEYIKQVKKTEETIKEKHRMLSTVLDISDESSKNFVISFLINADDELLDKIFTVSEEALNGVLSEGITEQETASAILPKIIRRNIEPGITKNQIKVVEALVEQVIVPNMVINEEATEYARKNAREMVAPVKVKIKKGDTIVKAGEPITPVKKEAMAQAGYNILKINSLGVLGIFCLVCIGIASSLLYVKCFEEKLFNVKYMSITAFLSLFTAIFAVMMPNDWSVYILPFPFVAMILSIFLNPRTSFMMTITLLTIITLSLQFSALDMSIFIITVTATIIGMTTVTYSRRFDLIKVGFYTAIIFALVIISVYYDLGIEKLSGGIIIGAANCFASGIFALGMIPLFENTFKVITIFGLAELGDYNQPLLKKLHETAPGTFEHSLRVSNLAESAAEAIGANPILARVGALYHDVGKIVRPLFFVENQTYSGIENPHEKLTPRSSKMIITSHTKDGLAKAKEYHIPEVICDFIIQHHGDSLASYFYNKAVQEEGIENVTEEQFRYTGPKPNTKETAILMIADAVESASRTLKEQSQEEIDALVNKIIRDRLNDNQLSESPLTLKDLKIIASTLSRVLRSVFHKRIKYQEAAVTELEEKNKKAE